MRLTLVLAVLVLARPAEAQACHRFSVWLYPWPQHCKVTHVAFQDVPAPDLHPVPAPPPRTVDESHQPDLTPDDEDAARAKAIEALRPMLNTEYR